MRASKPSDKEIVLTNTFRAPREAVFAAFTQTKHLPHWLGATGMTLVDCEIDLSPGGSFRWTFQRANGRKLEVRGAYETVEAPRTFSYRESYDFSPLEVHVTTTFDEAKGKTALKQRIVYATKQDFDANLAPLPQIRERIEQLARVTIDIARALAWIRSGGAAVKSAPAT